MCVCECIHTYMCVWIYTYMWVCVWICTYTYMCMNTYTHVHTRTYKTHKRCMHTHEKHLVYGDLVPGTSPASSGFLSVCPHSSTHNLYRGCRSRPISDRLNFAIERVDTGGLLFSVDLVMWRQSRHGFNGTASSDHWKLEEGWLPFPYHTGANDAGCTPFLDGEVHRCLSCGVHMTWINLTLKTRVWRKRGDTAFQSLLVIHVLGSKVERTFCSKDLYFF